jgi:hypothetical protein
MRTLLIPPSLFFGLIVARDVVGVPSFVALTPEPWSLLLFGTGMMLSARAVRVVVSRQPSPDREGTQGSGRMSRSRFEVHSA